MDSSFIFDKAAYHMESVESDKLNEKQAFVHTAFFITWCIETNLVSNQFTSEFTNSIRKIKERQITPADLYIEMDGVFSAGILILEGYNFAMQYFHLSHGKYIKDYANLKSLSRSSNSVYAVEDTWSNYEIVKQLLNKQFSKWK